MKKPKFGIVTNSGKYLADPSGRTNNMAWTYDKKIPRYHRRDWR